MKKRTVLLKIGVLIEVHEEELNKHFGDVEKLSNKIRNSIDEALNYADDSPLGWTYERPVPLDENEDNCGTCAGCGVWTTDSTAENPIEELSKGATVAGVLRCDLCLPPDHPLAF